MYDGMIEALRVAREQLTLPGLSEHVRRLQDQMSVINLTAFEHARATMRIDALLQEGARESARCTLMRDSALYQMASQSANLRALLTPAWDSRLSAVFNDMAPHSAFEEVTSRLSSEVGGIRPLSQDLGPPPIRPSWAVRAIVESPITRDLDGLADRERARRRRRKLARRQMAKRMDRLTIEVVALRRALSELRKPAQEQQRPPSDDQLSTGQYL